MFRGLSKLRNDRHTSHTSVDAKRVSSEKNELAITAPKRIVRALYPYTAQHDDELSFNKDDFFYVNEEASGDWYIASNPLTNSRGLVPQAYFEVIQKQDPQAVPVSQARREHSRSASQASAGSINSRPPYSHRPNGSQSSQNSSNRRNSLAIYGLVLYDFQAERNDELTVAAGESIVIVAQSTEEWFVAKPIGRLGGPGLIPVSYVELREVGSDYPLLDVQDAIQRANLPQVDEWKRKLAEYKASSIPLGRFGTTSDQWQNGSASNYHQRNHSRAASQALSAKSASSSHNEQQTHGRNSRQPSTKGANLTGNTVLTSQLDPLTSATGGISSGYHAGVANTTGVAPQSSHASEPYVISATVDRFAVNGGRYWYLVKVEMSDGRHRNLCRFYQDFYDFQIKLLEQFPDEAGRTGKTRTLPFMPGPLTLVTHTVSSQRRANLDDYVRDLIRMPPHVSQSSIVLQLFSMREGDVESSEATQQLPQPPVDESEGQYSGDIPSLDNDTNSADNIGDLNTTHNSSTNNPYGTKSYASEPSSSEPSRNNHAQQQQQQQPQYQQQFQFQQQPQYQQQRHQYQPYYQQSHSQASAPTQYQRQPSHQYAPARSHTAHAPSGSFNPQYFGDNSVNHSEVDLGHYNSLKIKLFVGSNAIAIRVPSELPFSEIYDKIATRLSMPSPKLYMTPDCSGEPIDNAAKFARALNGGTKIALYLGNVGQ